MYFQDGKKSDDLPSPRPKMPRRRYTRTVLFVILLFAFLTYSSFRFGDGEAHLPASLQAHLSEEKPQDATLDFKADMKSLRDIMNATLGFQKIFVVNLPERPDKLDAFTVASSVSGFRAEVLEGVHGQEISNKTLPSTDKLPVKASMRNNMIGCWRAHMNFARKMVTESLSTALVMEDDADWSVFLKNQLTLFAQGSQYITSSLDSSSPEPASSSSLPSITPKKKPTHPHSPYGSSWDLMWLGHCGSTLSPHHDTHRFLIENDPTCPAPSHRMVFASSSISTQKLGLTNHTRLVYRAGSGLCTYAYALSNSGAKKVLQYNSQLKDFSAIDTSLGAMCEKDPSFVCLGVFPALVDSHKPKGRMDKDSDIATPEKGKGEKVEEREQGITFNVVHSVRLNVDKMLRGEVVALGSKEAEGWTQWGDEEGVEEGGVTTRTLNRPAGSVDGTERERHGDREKMNE